MPTPWVPPDPDLPRPIRWDPTRPFSVFPLTLQGMAPHTEQPDHVFTVQAHTVGVMMLAEIDAAKALYHGVAIGDLSGLGTATSVTFKALYVPTNKTSAQSGSAERAVLPGSVSGVTQRWVADGKAVLTVTARTPATAETFYAVAVPYAPHPKERFSQFSSYLTQAAWAHIPASGASVDLALHASSGSEYGVFVATGLPAAIQVVSSAVKLCLK
jgi:hypothetical protein